jgi:tripartite-type tricarboxylate transporter receptor subunit TctC
MLSMRRSFAFVALLSLVLASTTDGAWSQDVGGFYQGKRVTIVVGSAAGSGYDVYARLLGRHMGGHLPGAPSLGLLKIWE